LLFNTAMVEGWFVGFQVEALANPLYP
jgi:hypothetical protein